MAINKKENGKLPDTPEPYWLDSVELPSFPALEDDVEADVVIVGGGITGITTAYLLVNEGYDVVILEAGKLLNGTTGHTTAKITAQHHLIYDELIQNIGKNQARLYYEANIKALKFIENIIDNYQIDCDFKKQDAYIYAATEKYARDVEKEARAYKQLNINGGLTEQLPLDIEMKNGIVMRDQAQFHPVKYLAALIATITEKGGRIFENTTAVNVDTGELPAVLTREGHRVTGGHVLSCSHFPFYEGFGLYSTRMYADRSYVLAVKPEKTYAYPGGMYISADQPTRSLRSVEISGEEMILIGGESHKTGQGKETTSHYRALENFGQQLFGSHEIVYRWSAQDLITLDDIPYIGNITSGHPNILIATGYRKWGMSNSTVAALLFREIIMEKKSPYQNVYTPSRFHVHPSLKNFLVENADVAEHLIKRKFEKAHGDIENLSKDEGAVITINGQKKGAYKDTHGKLYVVDTTCTHAGCEVGWNDAERTWDCPCHGSRFSYTGEIIEGPAETPLKQYDYTMLDNLISEDSGY